MGRGRGKATLKKNPTPGGRADRKVVLEYSSDESNPQQAEGAEAPKRVKKQIHLTLPMSPAHITTTETFATFFINHGLMRALQKAFAKRGCSTDQMREFITNFQKKHGHQVPMPKIHGDKDSSDSEGLELADGTKVGKKTTGSTRGGNGPSTSGRSVGRSGGRKRGRDDDGDKEDPNKRRKTGGENAPPKPMVACKEPSKKATVYPLIDRNLPVLTISCTKERTLLGHHVLDWTEEQKRKIHEARMQGETSETPQVQSRDCGSTRHLPLPEDLSAAHPEVTFSEVGEGDRPGLQDRPAVPVGGNIVSPGSSRGIPCQAVLQCQSVCHPCQASYHHAKGHPAGKANLRRARLGSHHQKQTFWSFSGPPPYSKRSSL